MKVANIEERPSQLLVYRASAGSGKTFTLAARYIALVLSGVNFRSILAVTFTKKATTEMKNRITSYLQEISSGKMADDDAFLTLVCEQLPESIVLQGIIFLRERAQEVLCEILNNYDRFSICTIDSFLCQLIEGLAQRLRLRATFGVDTSEEVYNEAVEQLLRNFNTESAAIKKYIGRFVEENIQDSEAWDVRSKLKRQTYEIRKEQFLINEEEVTKAVQDDKAVESYRKQLNSFLKDITLHPQGKQLVLRLKEAIQQFTNDIQLKCINNRARNSYKTFVEKCPLAITFGENQDFPECSPTIKEKLVTPEKWLKDWGEANADSVRADMENLIFLGQQYQRIRNSVTLSVEFLRELQLMGRIEEYVQQIQKENNTLLMGMVPILLHRELETGDADFILERSGICYNHVMIDEFQDTSILQWKIMKPLIEEMLSRIGECVLLVGDVKQSIYRWRNGDWKILNEIGSSNELGRFLPEATTEKSKNQSRIISMTRNFRSNENVITFNLELFKYLSSQILQDECNTLRKMYDEGYQADRISEYYNASSSQRKGGFVKVQLFQKQGKDKSNKRSLREHIIENMFDQIIMMKEQGMAQNDMMILVRDNKDAFSIVDFLKEKRSSADSERYKDISVCSAEAYLLKSSLSVNLLISALKLLNNPKDTVALYFLSFHYQNDILGNLYDWEDIHQGIKENRTHWLPNPFNNSLKSLPLYEIVEELSLLFLYKNHHKVLKDDSYVFAFYDLVQNYLKEHDGYLQGFLDFWEEKKDKLTISTIEGTGIQILTIHKSKGLESPTIFIPFCDWWAEKSSHIENLWCKPEEAPFNTMPLLSIKEVIPMENSIYSKEYLNEKFMLRVDNLNLLYVALTRAKQNLFISGIYNEKDKTMTNLLMDFLQNTAKELNITEASEDEFSTIEYEIGIPCVNNKQKSDLDTISLNLQNYRKRFSFRQSSDAYNFMHPEKEQSQKAINYGNLLHAIYSDIAVKEDTKKALDKYMCKGMIRNEAEMELLRDCINQNWNNPQIASWFDGSWTLFRECNIIESEDISTQKGKCYRPDRVMVKDGATVVIDFKTGQQSDEHKEQVNKYIRLLSVMGYKNITGYLWYISDTGSKIIQL